MSTLDLLDSLFVLHLHLKQGRKLDAVVDDGHVELEEVHGVRIHLLELRYGVFVHFTKRCHHLHTQIQGSCHWDGTSFHGIIGTVTSLKVLVIGAIGYQGI